MNFTDRTPAERVIAKLNHAGLIVWRGEKPQTICGDDIDADLDDAEFALVNRILREDWDAAGQDDIDETGA